MSSDLLEDRLRSSLDDVVQMLPLAHPDHPRVLSPAHASTPHSLLATEDHRGRTRRRSDHRFRHPVVLGGVAVASVAAVLVLTLLPAVSGHPLPAAAAQLRLIAARTASQPVPSLGPNELVLDTVKISVVMHLVEAHTIPRSQANGGRTVLVQPNKPIPDAYATVVGTVKEWSNAEGGSCLLATYGPPTFASIANREAWQAQFRKEPTTAPVPHGQDGGPVTYCDSTGGRPGLGSGGGVIDVSRLSTDPTVLARQLMTKSTGIAGLDQKSSFSGEQLGFGRVALLLGAPTIGATPAFRAALYRALALMPGVRSLGEVTTHSGARGVGFLGTTADGAADLIVDPKTGSFLELRGAGSRTVFEGLLTGIGMSVGLGAVRGSYFGVYSYKVQWVDRGALTKVVGTTMLPLGTSVPGT
jgi:hypothetical protein